MRREIAPREGGRSKEETGMGTTNVRLPKRINFFSYVYIKCLLMHPFPGERTARLPPQTADDEGSTFT